MNSAPGPEKTRHFLQSKRNGALEFAVRPGFSIWVHTQRR